MTPAGDDVPVGMRISAEISTNENDESLVRERETKVWREPQQSFAEIGSAGAETIRMHS